MYLLFLIGRILFGGYFIYNAFNHFTHVKGMSGYAATKSVPMPSVAIIFSGLLLLFGGVSVVLGVAPFIGLLCLIVFLIPVTFTMHSFWADTDAAARMGNQINFYKNMALLGAVLICFVIPRPWPHSL
ncbi:MAG TPA: DoxX family protein [candidate division Zixibacteria bacterium]|nr:DoxX family protein [candidate division Zixibacteria bacterium]